MTHVRLAMLARDEADRMSAVADAVGDLIDDYVVLVDDRSRDGTPEAVYRALGSAGLCAGFVFESFSQARNELFVAARRGLADTDYLLLVDPDSPPRGKLPLPIGEARTWSCSWRHGNFEYHLPILVAAGVDCRYEGAAHELLVGVTPVWTPSLVVEVEPKPFDAERAAEFVELLRAGAERGEPRDAFYLARTLKDLGRSGEAIEAYLRRAQMGDTGWVEETFICLLDAAVLMLPLDAEVARLWLERARDYRPGRLEPWYWLAWLANVQGCPDCATEIALEALVKPLSTDALFVNRWCERAGLVEELNKAQAALGAEPTTMESAHVESVRS